MVPVVTVWVKNRSNVLAMVLSKPAPTAGTPAGPVLMDETRPPLPPTVFNGDPTIFSASKEEKPNIVAAVEEPTVRQIISISRRQGVDVLATWFSVIGPESKTPATPPSCTDQRAVPGVVTALDMRPQASTCRTVPTTMLFGGKVYLAVTGRQLVAAAAVIAGPSPTAIARGVHRPAAI